MEDWGKDSDDEPIVIGPESVENPQPLGCLAEIGINLALVAGALIILVVSIRICVHFNSTIVGVLVGFLLLPTAVQVGMAAAALAAVFQVGIRGARVLLRWAWRSLISLPRKMVSRRRTEAVDEELPAVFEGHSWWPGILAFTAGVVAVCGVAALLLTLFAPDDQPGLMKMMAVLSLYNLAASAYFVYFGFEFQ